MAAVSQVVGRMGRLHDVVLSQTTNIGVHAVTTTAWCEVLDVAESELASTILIALELGYGSVGGLSSIEAHDAGASGASAWFVLDLGLLNLSNGSKKLDQVLVTSRPRKLREGVSDMLV